MQIRMRGQLHFFVLLLAALTSGGLCETSYLWDDYTPTGRLADWSYSGYRHLDASIPTYTTIGSVKNFGAKGDGYTDDTQAFKAALRFAEQSSSGGAIYVPAGRYKITDRLYVRKPRVVLKGAGPGESVLYIPTTLAAVDGRRIGSRDSPYAWSDGFVNIKGYTSSSRNTSNLLATVTRSADRGTRRLSVSSTSTLRSGTSIKIFMYNPFDNSLARYLYGNGKIDEVCDVGDCLSGLKATQDLIQFGAKVASVGSGYVELDRPLPFAVRTQWRPVIHKFPAAAILDSGVQDLTIEFSWASSPAHDTEPGRNGVYVSGAAHAWVKNVEVRNTDVGFSVEYSHFITLDGVVVRPTKSRATKNSWQGHIGIALSTGTSSSTVTNFRVEGGKYIHGAALRQSVLNVFKNGKGTDLTLDLHRTIPYSNLYSNIYVGKGSTTFSTGGVLTKGLPSSRTTFWNIRKEYGQAIEIRRESSSGNCGWGTDLTYVGRFSGYGCDGWEVDYIYEDLYPAELQAGQLARRK